MNHSLRPGAVNAVPMMAWLNLTVDFQILTNFISSLRFMAIFTEVAPAISVHISLKQQFFSIVLPFSL